MDGCFYYRKFINWTHIQNRITSINICMKSTLYNSIINHSRPLQTVYKIILPMLYLNLHKKVLHGLQPTASSKTLLYISIKITTCNLHDAGCFCFFNRCFLILLLSGNTEASWFPVAAVRMRSRLSSFIPLAY